MKFYIEKNIFSDNLYIEVQSINKGIKNNPR
jgi:hypothetical protein